MNIENLVKNVIDSCFQVHKALMPGYLESVYRKALIFELSSRGMRVSEEVPLRVTYKGHVVGVFQADIIVEQCLIVELKAVRELAVQHELQLVNYLCCTGIDNGILVNFGSEQLQVKRKYKKYTPKARVTD